MNATRWSNEQYESVLATLGARTGLKFRPDQRDGTIRGIEAAMRRIGTSDPDQFADLLRQDSTALDHLIVELTVGETYFFREMDHFRAIRRIVIPDILKRCGREHRIRMWSAGCASGEEPYSLAMLCDDMGLSSQCDVLATDISTEALNRAKRAQYRQWSLRGDSAPHAHSFLKYDATTQQYTVSPRIRSTVRFEFLNLAMDVYPSAITGTQALDLILCRNVFIYFDRQTIGDVAGRLLQCLAPGGWLMTASGDPSLSTYAAFETTVTDLGVFYRRPVDQPTRPAGDLDLSSAERPFTASTDTGATLPLSTAKATGDEPTRPPVEELVRAADAAKKQPSRADRYEMALARGDYAAAIELSSEDLDQPDACVVHVTALANIDTEQACLKCSELSERHPLSVELHYLHAVLLMELNRDVAATNAINRVVFLDGSLAMAHFLLGSIRQRRGLLEDAERSFRNVVRLCQAVPQHQIVPLSDSETYGALALAAEHHLRALRNARENVT